MKEEGKASIHFQNQTIEQRSCSTIGALVLEGGPFGSGAGFHKGLWSLFPTTLGGWRPIECSLSSLVRHRCAQAFSEVKDRPRYRTPWPGRLSRNVHKNVMAQAVNI